MPTKKLKPRGDSENSYIPAILQNFKLLSRSLDPTGQLLGHLCGLWPESDILQSLLGQRHLLRDSNSVQLLSFLLSLTTEDIEKFLDILRDYEQDHVANVLQKRSEKKPMSQEHVNLLDEKCNKLLKYMDPKGGLIDELISSKIFSRDDEQLVDNLADDYDAMARELIQILRRKSECSFDKFISALEATHQSHVVFILLGKGDMPVSEADISNLNSKLRVVSKNLVSVDNGLLESLVQHGAFTDSDSARVNAEKLLSRQNAMLLKLIKRKSQISFDKLKTALDESGQHHIAVEIFGAAVNGNVVIETESNLSSDAAHHLENDVRIELQQDTEIAQYLFSKGIHAHIDQGSIKVQFLCESVNALAYLQQIVTSGGLDRIFTVRYCPKFANRGLKALNVRISAGEFERCHGEFQEEMLMLDEHSKALLMSAGAIADRVKVDDELLGVIGLSKKRAAMIAEVSNDDKAKYLLEMMSRMPDRVFARLISALIETGQHDVARIIDDASRGVFPETIFEVPKDANEEEKILGTSSHEAHFVLLGIPGQINSQQSGNMQVKFKDGRTDTIPEVQFSPQQAFVSFETFITQQLPAEVKPAWDYVGGVYAGTRGGFFGMSGMALCSTTVDASTPGEAYRFCKAAENGELDILKICAKVETKDRMGRSLLWFASANGHKNIVKHLMKNSAKVNLKDDGDVTPLYVAAQQGHERIVGLLLQRNAEVNCRNKDGQTPLSVSSALGHMGVIKQLLDCQTNLTIDCEDSMGRTPLWFASSKGFEQIVNLLLEQNANASCRNKNGVSSLQVAVLGGHLAIVKALIEKNADVNALACNGSSALTLAFAQNRLDIVDVLIEHGATAEIAINFNQVPINVNLVVNVGIPQQSVQIVNNVGNCGVSSFGGSKGGVAENVFSGLEVVPNMPGHETVQRVWQHGGENPCGLMALAQFDNAAVQPANMNSQSSLCLAAAGGHTQIVSTLISRGADVNSCTWSLETPLHFASLHGHVDCVTELIKLGALVNAKTVNGTTALIRAAEHGCLDVVEILLKNGAKVDMPDNYGRFPLWFAVGNGKADVVQALIAHKALANSNPTDSALLLYTAINNNHLEVVNILVNSDIDVNARTAFKVTPLSFAAEKGLLEMVNILLEKGANVQAQDELGRMPLWFASANGHADVMKILLRAKADVDASNNAGFTPLHIAAHEGKTESVIVLLDNKANVNARTTVGLSALGVASVRGHCEIVQLLLDKKAFVNTGDGIGCTPLMIAAACPQIRTNVITLLIEHGADVDACTATGETALQCAADSGHPDHSSLLLVKGANVNAAGHLGRSALWYAASKGRLELVKYFISCGADVNSKADFTALYIAAHQGYLNITEELMNNGANVDACTLNGIHLLAVASAAGHSNVVNFLIRKGANIEVEDELRRTPLWHAAANNRIEVVKALISRDARVNSSDSDGFTPLHIALQFHHNDVVRELLQAGACVTAKSKGLLTARIRRESLSDGIMRLLEQAPAGYSPLEVAEHHRNFVGVELIKKASTGSPKTVKK